MRAHCLPGRIGASYLVVTKVNIVGLLKGNRKSRENQYPRSQAATSAIFIGLGGGIDELEGGDRRLVLVAQIGRDIEPPAFATNYVWNTCPALFSKQPRTP
jgi:hypothetical protein